jgi:MoaA/NifB/PqqE/SkfB family radical SAM enzyme
MWPENYHEVYQAARLLRDAGVDTMRLKQDNSGQRLLSPADRRLAQELIARIKQELVSDRFRLVEIHQLAHPSEMVRTCDTCSITNLMAAVGSDGHLYPCNYHPRPGGASYGSALEHGFQRVWEGQRRRELRRQLPHICPAVCDPFKNRANRLLAGANDVVATQGLDRLERHIEELAGFYASES